MTVKPQMASAGEDRPDAADRGAPGAHADPFVINLCSSTTPMALAHPDAPELKRFRFFVSRRLEDGRERFRLHMGYFTTLEEAEEWLSVVRDIYPGAWAGEAPGKRLRSRGEPAAALPAAPSLPVMPTAAPQDAAACVAALPAAPAAPPIAIEPEAVDRAAAAHSIAAPAPLPAVIDVPRNVEPAALRPAAAPAVPVPTVAPRKDLAAPQAARPAVAPPPPPAIEQPKKGATSAAKSPAQTRRARPAELAPLSNVREVMAALDETGDTQRTPVFAAQRPTPKATPEPPTLTDTQVMKILEERRTEEHARADAPEANIPLLRPDDTGTRHALKEAVQQNAVVSFAVQLQWSVQPLALDKVPPLAIFSAYTLYTVEGSREGRKWYGLRLGFFTDAIAAKQVAHYVRSEFTSVAVVPVSPTERGRATAADNNAAPISYPEIPRARQVDEIKLLNDEPVHVPSRTAVVPPRGAAKLATGGAKSVSPAARAAASRSKKLRDKARAQERRGPYSLEETLEILGAGSLEIDTGRGELINDTGAVRHLHVEARKNSPFSRLVARLTERVRKN